MFPILLHFVCYFISNRHNVIWAVLRLKSTFIGFSRIVWRQNCPWRQNWSEVMKMPSWRYLHHPFRPFCLHVGLPSMKAFSSLKFNFAFMKAKSLLSAIFPSCLTVYPVPCTCTCTVWPTGWPTWNQNAQGTGKKIKKLKCLHVGRRPSADQPTNWITANIEAKNIILPWRWPTGPSCCPSGCV